MIKKKFRRAVAGLLAACMIAPIVSPAGVLTAQAMELDNTDLGEGKSSSTAYKWVYGSGYGNNGDGSLDTWRFDLRGINGTGQNNYAQAKIQTTWSHKGYATWLSPSAAYNDADAVKYGDPSYGYGPDKPEGYNGYVMEIRNNAKLGNMEFKIELSPSPDDNYVFVDYYVYNKNNIAKTVYLGTGADSMIGNDDTAKCIITDKGIYMVNNISGEYYKSTFELVTKDASLGITETDTKWIGPFSSYWGNLYQNANITETAPNVDSGIAYSWKIDLHPYQTVHKRVAFSIRPTSYYVSPIHGNDSFEGSYTAPFATIEHALSTLGNKMGYIYIMDDVDIDATIDLGSNTSKDVTFAGSDFDINGKVIDKNADNYQSPALRRRAVVDDALFKTTGANIRFNDIIVDGNGSSVSSTAPLVVATNGTIGIQRGAVLTNNKLTSDAVGSALDITGSANLDMNFGEITGNISAGKGAVNFSSSGKFTVKNDVNIIGNTLADGTAAANVYLAEGKLITLEDELTGKIGITPAKMPALSNPVSTDGEELVIVSYQDSNEASKVAERGFSVDPIFYTDRFVSDLSSSASVRVTNSSQKDSSGKVKHDIVLKRDGIDFNIEYLDEDGFVIQESETVLFPKGETITVTDPQPPGYTLQEITISPSTPDLTINLNQGQIVGPMPDYEVTATFQYHKNRSTIYFYPNNGDSTKTFEGEVGDIVSGTFPTITKQGYIFDGWYLASDFSGTAETDLPERFTEAPVSYYAKWRVDPNVTFSFIVQYLSTGTDIVFQKTITPGYPVESPLKAEKWPIPSYKFTEGTVNPLGSGDFVTMPNDEFLGKIPGQNVTVNYFYEVDRSAGNELPLTIIHKTNLGTVIGTESEIHFPEDNLRITPGEFYGYEIVGWQITKGKVADESRFLTGAEDLGSFSANGNFTGLMPNQEVEIVYTYESNGEGYDYLVKYLNDGEDIIKPSLTLKAAEMEITEQFREIYGYQYLDASANPTEAGSFDNNHNFTGNMPNNNLTITYEYDKDLSKWSTLKYVAGEHGSLSIGEGVSNKVTSGSDGSYETGIIHNDGSDAGATGSYTWNDINDKKLLPIPKADKYYQFAGWYVEGSNEPLSANHRFTGDTTVVARFVEDPQWWIDIYFEAGAKGEINPAPIDPKITTLHVTKDAKWGDIESRLPVTKPDVNYLNDGWYKGEQRVKNADVLVDKQVYTARFAKDPAIFGTNVQTPDAEGRVDMDGSGKITVLKTGGDYKYIVADLDGKILAVEDGSALSDRLTFTSLSPGSRYLVYEAYADVSASVGGYAHNLDINRVSLPNEVLIPVIEKNYYISYDEVTDGKVKFVISPADSETDYALLDANGKVITSSLTNKDGWQTPKGNSPAIVEYSGLEPEQEYIVVGRPKGKSGILPANRIDDGTLVVMDPGGMLEIPTYIVETINGAVVKVEDESVNTNRQDGIEEGDIVRISADATNGQGGKFLYWRVIIGSANGLSGKITNRQVEFEMPANNLVICAYYEDSDSNANLEEEVRGGNENELAVDPGDIPDLREELTTPDDKELMEKNGADVTYKVVFNKNKATPKEQNAIKNSGLYELEHIEAFKAAWGLDITIERYVDGRKTSMATPSNAPQFQVITQLDDSDVDMMDYQLYRVEDDNTVSLVDTDADPEATGGLFRFEAQAGSRYVLVYNRAHRVAFFNEVISKEFIKDMFPEFPEVYYHSFKVRRGGNVEQYAEYYDLDTPPANHTLIDNDGVQHWYVDWSTRNMPESIKRFNPSGKITQRTVVYAYYTNNWVRVRDARKELEELLKEAKELSKDYFLTIAETEELMDAITKSQKIFDMIDRKATYEELQRAIDLLRKAYNEKKEIVDNRNNSYTGGKGTNSGGGTGGGGGTGSGTKANPFESVRNNSYGVGTNGNWVLVNAEKHQWSFVLNGGLPLRSMWAYLEYENDEQAKTGWYHFDGDGLMSNGWFRDEAMNWYYCDTVHDGWFGKMKTGWHYDTLDNRWYYLDSVNGNITLGWKEIEGKWYYFTAANNGNTYHYNESTKQWEFIDIGEKPLGSLHTSGQTPDGYVVDANGVWVN